MIPRTVPTWQSQTWQEQLINLVRDPGELCELLNLNFDQFSATHGAPSAEACASFPLRVPRSFIARMQKGNLRDPLLLQVLPQLAETLSQPGYQLDPLEEQSAQKAKGIIQKYAGRVLLMVTSACAIHCRYCFRRHFPYDDHRQSRQEWLGALQSIADDTAIHEVIFSGGDPLAAPDQLLAWLVEQIAAIPHVQTLRVHTRLPVVLPDRIDNNCIEWLTASRLRTVLVIHANHPQELDDSVNQALLRLRATPVTLLNQTVLLKGINDCAQTLQTLSEQLFRVGVLPYYLHLLDKVAGTQHFDLPLDEALTIHNKLKARLPGYLVPKLVREIAGEANKVVFG